MKTIQSIICLLALCVSTQALAKDVTLFFNKNVDGPKTLRLRHRLNALGYKVSNFKLEGVTMYAKSQRDRGAATLQVGRDKQVRRVKDAPRFGWNSWHTASFNPMSWFVFPHGKSKELWQMHIKGNVKIQRLVLHLKRKN